MRIFTLLLPLMLFSSLVSGQITINESDLPEQGDAFKRLRAANPQILDIQKAGDGQLWDYSTLNPAFASVDTYKSMEAVPGLYQTVSFLKGANLAKLNKENPTTNLPVDSDFSLDGLYSFFKKGDNQYSKVSYGISIGDYDIPLLFEENDVIYNFPLTYGETHTSNAFYQFPPSQYPTPDSLDVYFERSIERIDTVDAHGILQAPLGTFETIRVKSTITYNDSIYANGVGQNIPAFTEIQYKWLAKDKGIPVLKATAQPNPNGPPKIISATYQDSLSSSDPDTSDEVSIGQKPLEQKGGNIYPNPNNGHFSLKMDNGQQGLLKATVLALNGQVLGEKRKKLTKPGQETISLDFSNLSSGKYLLLLQKPNNSIGFHSLIIKE